jgi:LAO/AO transport system kinase
LWDGVLDHREHMHESGVLEQRRRFRLGEELREIVARRLEARARELCTGQRWDELTAAVLSRDIDPWAAADEMLHPVLSVASASPSARR